MSVKRLRERYLQKPICKISSLLKNKKNKYKDGKKIMKKLFVNVATQTIELSESFSKKAGNFGSNEYNQLKDAKVTYPTYRIKVMKATKPKDSDTPLIKGITRDFMYNYAKAHETEESVLKFSLLDEDATFLAVRKVFFECYPDFKKLKTQYEWHLAARA